MGPTTTEASPWGVVQRRFRRELCRMCSVDVFSGEESAPEKLGASCCARGTRAGCQRRCQGEEERTALLNWLPSHFSEALENGDSGFPTS